MSSITTRAEQAARTRQAILDTAKDLFAREGYDGTSLQMIADARGITKANVYHYFRTKADLLDAIIVAALAPFQAILDEAETIANRRDRAILIVERHSDLIICNRQRLMATTKDPGMREVGKAHEAVQSALRQALRLVFGDDPTLEERMAFSLVLSMADVVTAFADSSDEELRATIRSLQYRLLRVRP